MTSRCPGREGKPCGHPLDQNMYQTSSVSVGGYGPLTPVGGYKYPEWSPCDDQCEHGGYRHVVTSGSTRTGMKEAIVEARNRHPVEVSRERRPVDGLFLCATCAEDEQ